MSTAPDDAQLSAWIDGELPPDQRAAIEEWLRDHPEDAARVRGWSADARSLRSALDTVLDEPVPAALAQTVWRKAPAVLPTRLTNLPWPRWAAAVGVFVLGGAVGAALMWRVQGSSALAPGVSQGASMAGGAAWVQRAAMAHSVYVPEQRHAVEVKAQEEHLSRWLTKRLDVPVKLFDLRAQGFELVGGRLLPDASGPSAQLMYQAIAPSPGGSTAEASAKPERVTVYLRKPDDATPAAFRYEQQGELGLFYWVEGQSAHGRPTGYAIVGTLPREKLLALAQAIYAQDPSRP